MQCPKCRNTSEAEHVFCFKCGTKLGTSSYPDLTLSGDAEVTEELQAAQNSEVDNKSEAPLDEGKRKREINTPEEKPAKRKSVAELESEAGDVASLPLESLTVLDIKVHEPKVLTPAPDSVRVYTEDCPASNTSETESSSGSVPETAGSYEPMDATAKHMQSAKPYIKMQASCNWFHHKESNSDKGKHALQPCRNTTFKKTKIIITSTLFKQ